MSDPLPIGYQLPSALKEAFDTGKVTDAHGKSRSLDSNISLEECEALHAVVRTLSPNVSAEIGFACGVSTVTILQALHENGQGMHHVIDPFQDGYGDAGLSMVARSGLSSHFQFHRAFPEEVMPTLPALDFAFIDASHLFDLTLLEFVLADKKLRIGGVIAFHDLWMPSLSKVVRFILSNRSYVSLATSSEKSAPPHQRSIKHRMHSMAARSLRGLPLARRLFRAEVLQPWSSYPGGNLVFLRKSADDNRDWRHFRDF